MMAEWKKLLGQHPDSRYRLTILQHGFSHANESALGDRPIRASSSAISNHQQLWWDPQATPARELILDLSRPKGSSVNDGIDPEVCSPKYVSVDQAVHHGTGSMSKKIDIESAYHCIQMTRPLLWRDKLYIDATLPFGLRSAPKILNAVADAMEWIFRSQGIELTMHHLDDFIMFGGSSIAECKEALDRALQFCPGPT